MKTGNVRRPAPLIVPSLVSQPLVSSDFYSAVDLKTSEVLSPSSPGFRGPMPTSPSYSPVSNTYYLVTRASLTFRPAVSSSHKRNMAKFCSSATEWVLRNKETKVQNKKKKTALRPSTRKKVNAKFTK